MLQPVQALKTDEKQRCVNMQEKLEDESEERLVFSAVATYKNIYVQHSKCSHFTGGTKTEDIWNQLWNAHIFECPIQILGNNLILLNNQPV